MYRSDDEAEEDDEAKEGDEAGEDDEAEEDAVDVDGGANDGLLKEL